MFHAAGDFKIGGFSSPQPQPQPLKNEFSLDPLQIMSPLIHKQHIAFILFRILSALKLKNMWVPTLSFKHSKMSPITFTAHRFNFPQLHDPRNLGFVSLSHQTFKYLGFPPPILKTPKNSPLPQYANISYGFSFCNFTTPKNWISFHSAQKRPQNYWGPSPQP